MTRRTTRPLALLAALALLLLPSSALLAQPASPPAPPPSLAGTWRLVPKRSTDLTPWQTFDLIIAINGSHISIQDKLAAGTRAIDTVATLDLNRSINLVPVPWWPDNRHIGAYIGGDRTEHVHASWLDGGRILRTDANLVLDTQQGSHEVNILTDYKISPSGNQLTLVQLRSTREIPIIYVFKRVVPDVPVPAS